MVNIKLNNSTYLNVLLKRKALKWWNKLSKSEQTNIENKIFGIPICDYMEDNTLSNTDIINMYKKTMNI